MPYAHIKKKIPPNLDRRIKLTEQQKKDIKEMRNETGASYQSIADRYDVSKRLIQFICNPDKYEKAKKQFKDRRLDGRYKPSKEAWRDTMREHRRYKQSIKDHLI